MKLSEYAADLLAMAELYGDHEIVERNRRLDGRYFFRLGVRPPQLCRVATMPTTAEVIVAKTGAEVAAQRLGATLTNELVYVR